MNKTIDIDDIIPQIFNNEPGNAKSLQLSFDVSEEYELFKLLVHILTEGLKILYGNNENKVILENLTDVDFLKIKQYFNSFGFIINYTTSNILNIDNININEPLPSLNNSDTHNKTEINNKNTELHLYYFTLKTERLSYEITFDYLS